MGTQTVADGQGNIAITTSLLTTAVIDLRLVRTAFIRSATAITGTLYAAREGGEYKAIKLAGSGGSDHTMSLVDAWQPLNKDLFPIHSLKIVGSEAAVAEWMGKA